ncbi:MAG: sugar/nucleoside kinase (ribokinase family) [Clostridium sp.]|jgi:sugar/nucleoside kinase (ribokinase family)
MEYPSKLRKKYSNHIRTHKVHVVNATGAGDASRLSRL